MKKIIEGFATTFENAKGEKNIPIEYKRNIREDASWNNKRIPCELSEQFRRNYLPVLTEDQAQDIRYERNKSYESKGLKKRTTNEEVFNAQIGEPTHPITKALLNAETQRKIDDEIRKTYGKKGWLESLSRPSYNSRTPLENMTNEQLINILFINFKRFTPYGDKLKTHFKANSGHDLIHNLNNWKDGEKTKKDALIEAICKKVKLAYYGQGAFPINITKEIEDYWLDFTRALYTMLGEAAAFVGMMYITYITTEREMESNRLIQLIFFE